MNKEEIRSKMRARKGLLTQREKTDAAEQVFNRIENTAAFLLADRVLVYHSLPDELPTLQFIERWKGRKKFFLPRVNGLNLEILPFDESRLAMGSFHIEEPQGNDLTSIDEIDLVIMPGIAYDRLGNRVGRGKGYYDRLLQTARHLTTIGVGYDFQLLDEDIPADSHDVWVDVVATDRRCIVVHRKRK